MYENDKRVVMTLDAGGTNFVFSAIAGNKEIVEPISFASQPNDLEKCLKTIENGFRKVMESIKEKPVAISFAFPGPADYASGIIGDLPNFPSFRGGVALGPFLEERFGLPVFINNDGDLFAYGEALSGDLVDTNNLLEQNGSNKHYKNLLGVTIGTGFGGGVVINNQLLSGDNGCGGDVWVFRNKMYSDKICEESVSIRAVKRCYEEICGESAKEMTPKDIFDIAEGTKKGNQNAAVRSFEMLGEVAGNTIAQALTIVDGLVVIGGGLTGAAKYFLPAIVKEMNGTIGTFAGDIFPRMQMKAYNLENHAELNDFLADKSCIIDVPYSTDRHVKYNHVRETGVVISKLGASKAIALGAYAYAISKIDM